MKTVGKYEFDGGQIGETVTVSGTVDGYPRKDVVRIVCKDGIQTESILIDRADVTEEFPRDKEVTVTGVLDTEQVRDQHTPSINFIVRLGMSPSTQATF